MRSFLAFLMFVLCFSAAAADGALEQRIAQRVKEFGAESVSVYFEYPDGRIFAYNADTVYHAASTMKVPVMMEVFRQIETGGLKWDQPVAVNNSFASIVDGSPFSVGRIDDDDPEFHDRIGKQATLSELVEHMINRSSNLATNLVIELVTPEKVRDLMMRIGADHMHVLRGVEDIKAYEAGRNNTTSARALALCMKAILDPNLFRETSRKEMFRILASQHYREGIPAGIKADERKLQTANKTGEITEISHDAAILRDAQGRVWILVVLTRGVVDPEGGRQLVAALAGDVWNFMQH